MNDLISISRRSAILSTAFSTLLYAQQGAPERYPDVPYVPTPVEVVERMLRLADVHKGDVVYDLGCGDGRIVIMAAEKFNATATSVDIDPELIRDAREKAKKAGVNDKAKFIQGDLFETDIRPASVVARYLLPTLTEKLGPKLLAELKPGTRIVSIVFGIGDDWKPDKFMDVKGSTSFSGWFQRDSARLSDNPQSCWPSESVDRYPASCRGGPRARTFASLVSPAACHTL